MTISLDLCAFYDHYRCFFVLQLSTMTTTEGPGIRQLVWCWEEVTFPVSSWIIRYTP